MMPAPGEPLDTLARTRLEAALGYAERGWPVFPLHWPTGEACSCGKPSCSSRGKHPRTKNGLKDATVNRETVSAWWGRWPLANVGIATGAVSGFVVIDVDAGGDDTLATLEAEHERLPATLEALTGNGRHILFARPGNVEVRNNAGTRLGPGLDIRGDGGYIVAPPSAHASGRSYRWSNEDPIADLPDWLLELVQKPEAPPRPAPESFRSPAPGGGTTYGLAALDGELEKLRQAGDRTRNNTLNLVAFRVGQLIPHELERGHVEAALHYAAIGIELDDGEARKTIASGLDGGVKSPRYREAPESFKGRRHLADVSLPKRPDPKEPAPPADSPAASDAAARRGFPLTDLGNAERLVDLHGSRIRYCHPWQTWLVWDGRRWARDRSARAELLATETVRRIYVEASEASEEQERKAIADWAKRSEANVRIRAMLDLATSRPGVPVLPEDLDVNPWVLNCRNGTLDLATGELRPHDPDELLTKLAPVDFNPEAKCELLDTFLHGATGGDAELQAFVQRAAGYTLVGNTAEEVLFLIHGPAAAGKSTFLEAFKAALGDYAITMNFEALLPRSAVGGATPDIARLAGQRFVCSIEVDQGRRLAEGLVKTLTGGDTITARPLYREPFEFRPSHTFWLAANHAPTVREDDDGMWRRILRVPFEHPVPRDQRDPQVKTLLQDADFGRPAVLAWAVKGCLDWRARGGLDVPSAVRDATQAYREEMDPLRDFVEDCCLVGPEYWAATTTLMEQYVKWTHDNGVTHPISRDRVAQGLKARGAKKEGTRPRGWRGIGLRDASPTASQDPLPDS
jgi:putative DNA primase/helicase